MDSLMDRPWSSVNGACDEGGEQTQRPVVLAAVIIFNLRLD